jgi:muconolactone delta-isomerase
MSERLCTIWAREAEGGAGAKKAGAVIDIWKCAGSRRVVAIIGVDSPDTLDQIVLDLPIMKELGQPVRVDVSPSSASMKTSLPM